MIFKTKLRKEFLARKAREYYDYETKEQSYLTHGTIGFIKVSSGKIAVLELITWLPFIDYGEFYDKAENAQWMLLGFKDETPIDKMKYRQFKKEMKKWIKRGDVI